ncbi:MAG: TetR/AcrR family transcriptional regulator [Actinomycetota bacterium]|nr:TetR/AcrR family transcriptional regulator [Actinomycetota bacterium]
MTSGGTSFPTRRATAARNRDKILGAASNAFADRDAEVSMAEIARRAGVGMATLYRNFPGRRELLEALYVEEVDAICRAARIERNQTAGQALTAWLRLLFDFIPTKRLILAELLEHAAQDTGADPSQRHRALAAGRPLLSAAQQAGEIRSDITLGQIFDVIVAIAKIHGDADYLEPIVQALLDGLRTPPGHPTT